MKWRRERLLKICRLSLLAIFLSSMTSCYWDRIFQFSESSVAKLSKGVCISRTSESTFGLVDEDGMSLIYGKLIKASFGKQDQLFLEYIEYLSRSDIMQGKEARTLWAEINLETRVIQKIDNAPNDL